MATAAVEQTMAKASDLIGKSGAGGIGPSPKRIGSEFTKPAAQGEKEGSKAAHLPKKEGKAKSEAKPRRAGGATTSPSVRPKV
jgi:hypothetical protein